MNPNDIRTLKLLEELDNNHTPSQRDLARSLGVSLGLVNSFLKRLVNKGYFKVTTIPKNRVRYMLTPKGAAEKTRLTYEYIGSSYRFYKEARQRLRDLFETLHEQGVRRIVIYGANDLAEIAYLSLMQTDIDLVAVADETRQGERFMGKEVLAPERLQGLGFDRVLVASVDAWQKAHDHLLKLDIPREKIVR